MILEVSSNVVLFDSMTFVAVAEPRTCLLGAYDMLMSDGSWVNASVKTSGQWCCMEK